MRILLLIAIVLNTTAIRAQPSAVTLSEPFPEISQEGCRIILADNGFTFFLQIARDSINVRSYKRERTPLGSNAIDKKSLGLSRVAFMEVIGMGDELLLFIQNEGKLNRVHVDASTCAISSQSIIDSDAYACHVEKSLFGDYYFVSSVSAVGKVNYRLFSADHKEVSLATHTSSEDYSLTKDIGAYLHNDVLIVASYGNRKNSDKGLLIVSKLKAGDTKFSVAMADCEQDLFHAMPNIGYNPGNGKLYFLTVSQGSSHTKKRMNTKKTTTDFTAYLSVFDPANQGSVKTIVVENTKANDHLRRQPGQKDDLVAVPKEMVVNEDNSVVVISEEVIQETIDGQNMNVNQVGYAHGPHYRYPSANSQRLRLNNIAITTFNDAGDEISGQVVPKAQLLDVKERHMPYSSKVIHQPIEFYSYKYLSTEKGHYVIFNDFEENLENYGKKKVNVVDQVSNTNTVCHDLKQKKQYLLYGTSGGKFTFTDITTIAFSKKSKTYAALVTQRERRNKVSRIAWVVLE
ncbi:MAG TPA: hypothetical protein VEB40_12530 [Flavipsychrobacter sp.]|nr:hypothetical protein [Flavipsychrobacter sp.]